jgi:hypothetical protein
LPPSIPAPPGSPPLNNRSEKKRTETSRERKRERKDKLEQKKKAIE